MKNVQIASAIATCVAISSSSLASIVSGMVDNFSDAPGFGFTRGSSGSVSVTGGQGVMSSGSYFSWTDGSADVSGFSGICFRVTGDLTGAELKLSLLGDGLATLITDEVINSHVSGGWAYVSFDSLSELYSVDTTIPMVAIAIGVSGNTSPISIDDVQFAVPAPGAAALVGLAGLMARRRRA